MGLLEGVDGLEVGVVLLLVLVQLLGVHSVGDGYFFIAKVGVTVLNQAIE